MEGGREGRCERVGGRLEGREGGREGGMSEGGRKGGGREGGRGRRRWNGGRVQPRRVNRRVLFYFIFTENNVGLFISK